MGSKTWTTTADFDTATISGLATAGDELSMGLGPGTWAAGGDMATVGRYVSGFGISTASVRAGSLTNGSSTASCEEYDGTTWGNSGNLNVVIQQGCCAGEHTAGLSFSGLGSSQKTEEYNGATWAIGGDLIQLRTNSGGIGDTTTACLCAGGIIAGADNSCEEYDGSAWGVGNTLNAVRDHQPGVGGLTAGLTFGSAQGYLNSSEEHDGTAWAGGGNLSSGKGYMGGAGVLDDALCIGGYSGQFTAVTEEYGGTVWAIGGNLAVNKHTLGACGTGKAAGVCFGGYNGTAETKNTEEYTAGLIASGTWTIDIDGSAIVTFSPIACNIGSTVQARIKTAVNQAGLGAAAWVPATGYYTAFPATVTASVNQWSRLEFSLSGVETVQDITLSWAELLFGGNPSSSFGLGINRKLSL